ncbi:MAG: hypothetical protein AAFN18_08440 [Cyanobacteria bacterium J06554_6]
MGTGLFETSSLRYLQNSVESISYYLVILQRVGTWAGHHPYWTVAIAILSLTVLNSLISLTSDALKRAVAWALRTPLLMIQWAMWKGLHSTQQALKQQKQPTIDEQIVTVLQQIETLRQEQDTLLSDLKTLIASR